MAVMRTAISVVALLVSATCEGLIRDDFVPKCRAGVCDDRPECPISDCTCIFLSQVDCAVYYRCKRGKPYQDRCSPGLLMNPITLTCDYANNVNCSYIVRTTASSSSTSVATPPNTSKPTVRTTVQSTTVTEPPTTSKSTVRTTLSSTSITTPPTTPKLTVKTIVPSSSTPVTTPPSTQDSTFRTTVWSSSSLKTSPVTSTSVQTTENTQSLSPNITHFNTETTSETTTSRLTSTNEIPSSTATDSGVTETKTRATLPSTQTTSAGETTSTEEKTTKWETSPSTNFVHSSTVSPTKYSTETNPATRTFETTYSMPFTTNSTIHTTFSKSVSPTQMPSTTPSPSRPFVCPSYYGLFPDPKNCNRFYHCSHGFAYHKWCPSNLHFNPELLVCDWPRHAGCELFSTTQEAPTTPNLKTTPTAQEPSTSTPTVAPPPMNQTCDCDCCILPVAGDCTAFILCMGEVPFQMSCLHGLFFNPMTSTCDKPENVDCKPEPHCPERNGRFPYPDSCTYYMECKDGIKQVKKCPEGLNYDDISKTCSWTGTCGGHLPPSPSPSDDTSLCLCDCCFLPDPDDCARYTKCWNGEATKGKCADGLLFNKQTENCDYDHNVQCPAPSPSPECPANFGVFQYPGQCNLYIQCVEGIPNIKKCPGILHFSEKKKSCDWPWSAGCHDSHPDPTSEPNPGEVCECDCCFIPDKMDCSSFTLCVDGVGKKETCSSGLLFNAVTENCDFEENVQCNDSSDPQGLECPEYEGLFPHPDDCDKFIHCAHGHPYVKECPSVLHFNPVLKVCDWPYSAGCMGFPTMEPPPILPSHPCDICDSCLIPDRYDCAAYTVCDNGTAFEMRCADGLFFNQDINNCDYSDDIICPDMLSGVCPKHFGLFQVEDCSKFMHCSHGIAYIKDCPSGLHFNQATDRCDYPCDANCDKTLNCPSKVTTFSTNKPTTNNITPSIYCKRPSGLFPNTEDCGTFFRCSNGYAYLINCPYGLHFNENLQQCDEPCIAKCDLSIDCPSTITTSTYNPTTNITPSIYCKHPSGLFPNPEDCETFYQCTNGYAYRINCPYGLHFNENLQQCDQPCAAKCDLNIDCPSTLTTPTTINPTTKITPSIYCKNPNGLFINPEDCRTFYQCNNNYAYLINCPYGLHFNENLQQCDEPCTAKCNLSIDCSSPVTTSTTSIKPTTTTSIKPTTTTSIKPTTTTFIKPTTTTSIKPTTTTSIKPTTTTSIKPVTTLPHCKLPSGLFSNPDNCNTFYQCSNGYAYLMNCPSGLHFNENVQQCDEPCAAKCDITFACPTDNPGEHVNCTCDECLLPDPSDCSAYYYCKNYVSNKEFCPYGMLFSKETYSCDIEDNVECIPNGDPAMCLTPSGVFSYPGDCHKFVHCESNTAYIEKCPDNLQFNVNTSTCDYPDGSCGPAAVDPNCLQPTGLFPHNSNCSLFYHCDHGVAYLKTCPDSLYFNPSLEVCDWQWNVNCGKGSSSSEPTFPKSSTELSKTSSAVTGEITRTAPTESSSKKYETTSIKPIQNSTISSTTSTTTVTMFTITPTKSPCHIVPGVTCPCACRVPTYDECSSFYQCEEDGTACKMFCPEGLYFNKRTMMCDLPDNVHCREFFFAYLGRHR